MLLVADAREWAIERHTRIDHRRRYTDEPYWVHLDEVAGIVAGVPHTQPMLAGCWLHDTVEDTGASLVEIEAKFGSEVASLVEMLTDVSKPSDGTRSIRKAIDRAHTAKASPAGKTMKLGDMISNTRGILRHDPAFAKVYLPEKAMLLDVLREGDPQLWHRARAILVDGVEQLGLKITVPTF